MVFYRKYPVMPAGHYNKKYYRAPKKRVTSAQEYFWKKWVHFINLPVEIDLVVDIYEVICTT